jgi:adenylylsulfate kinase-like enzyme
MKKISFSGIWFCGVSGSGKTIASKIIKKNFKNSILLDGDKIRKLISFDLGYCLTDRKVQINRVFGIAQICISSGIFPIITTVYMNQNMVKKLKQNKIIVVNILREFSQIKNRKKIYNNKIKDVVGVDIKFPKLKNVIYIKNNSKINVFLKEVERLINAG